MDRIFLYGETEADDDTGCPPYKYGLLTPPVIDGGKDEEHDGLMLMNDIAFFSTISINDITFKNFKSSRITKNFNTTLCETTTIPKQSMIGRVGDHTNGSPAHLINGLTLIDVHEEAVADLRAY